MRFRDLPQWQSRTAAQSPAPQSCRDTFLCFHDFRQQAAPWFFLYFEAWTRFAAPAID